MLDVAGLNDGCIYGDALFSVEVGSSRGGHCHWIVLVRGQWETLLYKSVCPDETGGDILCQRRRQEEKMAQTVRK